jgi:hypothetical protein
MKAGIGIGFPSHQVEHHLALGRNAFIQFGHDGIERMTLSLDIAG